MSYFNKYLKYKNKYLTLLNTKKQKGGYSNPLILKDFNLFANDNPAELYLNPVYGYILFKSEFLKNCITFKQNNYNTPLTTFVTECFSLVDSELKLKSNILQNIKPEHIAIFAGYWFMYGTLVGDNELLDNITNMIKITTDYLRNKYNSISKTNKDKVCVNLDSKFRDIDKFIKESSADYVEFSGFIFNYSEPEKSLKDFLIRLKNTKQILSDFYNKNLEEFNKRYKCDSKNDVVNTIFSNKFKYLNKDNMSKEMFYVLLAILWMISKNKQDYKIYYSTLNTILDDKYKVFIPINYENIIFNTSEITEDLVILNKENTFFKELVKISSVSPITIHTYDYVNINDIKDSFADCAETAIRNFINILIYDKDTNVFSLEKLKLIDGIPELIDFYTVYNTDATHTNDQKYAFNFGEYNARTAWAILLSNLPTIRYKKEVDGFKYEVKNGHGIKTNENNLLNILKYLFKKIEKWEDFVENGLITTLFVSLDEHFAGEIKFDSYIWEITVSATGGHSSVRQTENFEFCDRINIEDKYREYFDILTINSVYDNYSYINNWLLFVKYDMNSLIDINNYLFFNSNNTQIVFDAKLYAFLVEESFKYTSYEELYRLYVLHKYILNKININVCTQSLSDYSNYTNLKYLYIEYTEKYNDFMDETIEYNKFFDINSIKNNVNLESIYIIKTIINNPVGDSFDKLTNLRTLSLDVYNQPLNDSLKNLTNLTELTLDMYNYPLNDLLKNLTNNLTYLSLNCYNHPLNDSLKNLTNLTFLSLASYNFAPNDFLLNLSNLKSLSLNVYNYPLNNSLQNLTNVDFLKLDNYNCPLDDSLLNLTKLSFLSLNNYNHPLNNSLQNLTNLNNLILNNYNMPLNNSLDNLTRLGYLSLKYYNCPLQHSLKNLTILHTLILKSYTYLLGSSLSTLKKLYSLDLSSYTHDEIDDYIHVLIKKKIILKLSPHNNARHLLPDHN